MELEDGNCGVKRANKKFKIPAELERHWDRFGQSFNGNCLEFGFSSQKLAVFNANPVNEMKQDPLKTGKSFLGIIKSPVFSFKLGQKSPIPSPRAARAAMGRRMEVMEREDSEAAFLVDIARISVDLRETFSDSQMFQDGFDEENPEQSGDESGCPGELVRCLRLSSRSHESPSSSYPSTNHERIPGHGVKKLVEQSGEAQLIDDPVIAVDVDDRLVKVENHDNSGRH
nr:uncharacterized protein LOC108848928 [Ipomoea batatas]